MLKYIQQLKKEYVMDYLQKLKHHYRPEKGWVNDPNGLVYFDGYYHVFYQHAPDYELPWKQPMHWGHARTKDFITYEELPIALYPDKDYDKDGCWSGTATVKDGVLYLFYAAIKRGEPETESTMCVAYSTDGINFVKYENNPVIKHYPPDGGPAFRDPAICRVGDEYYCVMAAGNPETKMGRLLLYKSVDLFSWDYLGIMAEWENCHYCECPSFMPAEDGLYLLSASVCPLESRHYFRVMYGTFEDGKFEVKYSSEVDRGPDQYAGQIFRDHKGRNILISWAPGWAYQGHAEKDIGCMSVPREVKLENGRITAYPIEEIRHLLTDNDPSVKITENGFMIEREGRDPVVYEGKINDIKILRDTYLTEVYINGGEEVYTALL